MLVYISPAAHKYDNSTKCATGSKCSENTHCREYAAKLADDLKRCGVEVIVGKALTGSAAIDDRVTDANRRGAALYYVCHTNAGGGRYSMTMCWPDAQSRAKAQIIHNHHVVDIPSMGHKVKDNNALAEIKRTKMTCLYDELFFHDNALDCTWFHNGGMERLAESRCKAICEIVGAKYVDPIEDAGGAVDEQLKELQDELGKVKAERDELQAKLTQAIGVIRQIQTAAKGW